MGCGNIDSNPYIRNQDEIHVANESWAFYSNISNPSFVGFEDFAPKEKFLLEKFILNPYVREIMLANLDKKQVKLSMAYFNLIIGCNMVKKLEVKIDLTPSANLYARKLLALIMLSMGTEQTFLKTMLTNYSISEQRMEEKAYQEIKQDQKEEEKKNWNFGLPKRRG